jgi:hypothetical protein
MPNIRKYLMKINIDDCYLIIIKMLFIKDENKDYGQISG